LTPGTTAGGQIADLAGIDRGLRLKFESLQRSHTWEMGDGHRHRQSALFLAGHLGGTLRLMMRSGMLLLSDWSRMVC